MDSSQLIRPNIGLYDPNYDGSPIVARVLSTVLSVLLVSFTIFVIASIITIVTSPPQYITLNLITLLVEIMIGYYSLILFWHLTRIFYPVDRPLVPVITDRHIESGDLPFVSILLTSFREPLSVVSQSLIAANDMNYPREKYEIMVFEDGKQNNDVEDYCENNGIRYMTRDQRTHFKAGAVNASLPFLKGEYVVFIDADHILERNIILNCLKAWREGTIAVQTRIDFVNLVSFLTTVSAFMQIQFFSLIQRGRRSSGSAVFAGGAALFHRAQLLDQGGMQTVTIADDTDTSLQLAIDGHRIEYIDVIGAWALVPWDPLHLIRQVWRWSTGITRSFRERSGSILRHSRSNYVRLDHFTTSFYFVIGIVGWLTIFLFVLMVHLEVPLIRGTEIPYLALFSSTTIIVNLMAPTTAILAFLLDDPIISYRQKPVFQQVYTLVGFLLLVVCVQPLLLGAVIKGLTGRNVEFNRTPKVKESTDEGLSRVKLHYLIYTVLILMTAVLFFITSIQIPVDDPRRIPLYLGAYTGFIPIIIGLLWYWKLEGYLLSVGDTTAIEFLEQLDRNQK